MADAIDEARGICGRLMPRGRCVLGYDRSLADQAPEILWEMHGIRPGSDAAALPELGRLFDLLDPSGRLPRRTDQLPALIAGVPALAPDFGTRGDAGQAAKEFDHWTEKNAQEDLGSVITLQMDLGQGRHNASMERYEARRQLKMLRHYLGSVTSAPRSLLERVTRRPYWELKLRWWRALRLVRADLASLSVGPRWVTEIHYFRDVLGFRGHIGLDLFSDDPSMVIAGDMHKMPFEDGRFGFVFLKNVVDKSYDVRKLVEELVRVSAPGGVVIVDQICGYGYCTPVTRTDIQSAANLRALFKARVRTQSLVCTDIDVSGVGDASASGARRLNARLAIRILK
jgi:SAM-dependent methyltransferase